MLRGKARREPEGRYRPGLYISDTMSFDGMKQLSPSTRPYPGEKQAVHPPRCLISNFLQAFFGAISTKQLQRAVFLGFLAYAWKAVSCLFAMPRGGIDLSAEARRAKGDPPRSLRSSGFCKSEPHPGTMCRYRAVSVSIQWFSGRSPPSFLHLFPMPTR